MIEKITANNAGVSNGGYIMLVPLNFEETKTLNLGTDINQFGEKGSVFEGLSVDFIIEDKDVGEEKI